METLLTSTKPGFSPVSKNKYQGFSSAYLWLFKNEPGWASSKQQQQPAAPWAAEFLSLVWNVLTKARSYSTPSVPSQSCWPWKRILEHILAMAKLRVAWLEGVLEDSDALTVWINWISHVQLYFLWFLQLLGQHRAGHELQSHSWKCRERHRIQ